MPRNALSKVFYLFCFSVVACYPMASLANGFYIPFYNAAELGDAFSGGAAIAQDASTAYTNPAGLTRIDHQQIVISAIAVDHRIKFNGTATSPGLGSFTSETGESSSNFPGVIPAFYYALPLSNRWVLGFSVVSPYGLGDDYDDTSLTRYYVTYAQAQSADIGPEVAYKITDKLSAGVGLDALYMRLKAGQMYRTQPLTVADSSIANDSSGWGYGWHAGLLYEFTPQTRVGLSYHSSIVERLEGTSRFYMNNGPTSTSNNLESTTHLPPFTTLSVYHDMTPAWAVMATAEYMQWSFVKNDHEFGIATFAGPININAPKNFHDTWRFAVGTSYQLTDKWLLRAGTEYDQNPTNNTDRDPILPSADRYLASIGAHYQVSKNVGLDAGYAHAFFENQSINNINTTTGNTINGTSKMSTDTLGLQVEWNIT